METLQNIVDGKLYFHMYLTPNEFEWVQKASKKMGVSMQTFIRTVVLEAATVLLDP